MAHIFDATPPNQGPESAGFAESEMRGGLNCHVELLPLRVKYGRCLLRWSEDPARNCVSDLFARETHTGGTHREPFRSKIQGRMSRRSGASTPSPLGPEFVENMEFEIELTSEHLRALILEGFRPRKES